MIPSVPTPEGPPPHERCASLQLRGDVAREWFESSNTKTRSSGPKSEWTLATVAGAIDSPSTTVIIDASS